MRPSCPALAYSRFNATEVVESEHELSGRHPQHAGPGHDAVHGLSLAAVFLAQMRYHIGSTVIGRRRSGVIDAAAASALSDLGIKVISPTVRAGGHASRRSSTMLKNQANNCKMECGSLSTSVTDQ